MAPKFFDYVKDLDRQFNLESLQWSKKEFRSVVA